MDYVGTTKLRYNHTYNGTVHSNNFVSIGNRIDYNDDVVPDILTVCHKSHLKEKGEFLVYFTKPFKYVKKVMYSITDEVMTITDSYTSEFDPKESELEESDIVIDYVLGEEDLHITLNIDTNVLECKGSVNVLRGNFNIFKLNIESGNDIVDLLTIPEIELESKGIIIIDFGSPYKVKRKILFTYDGTLNIESNEIVNTEFITDGVHTKDPLNFSYILEGGNLIVRLDLTGSDIIIEGRVSIQ